MSAVIETFLICDKCNLSQYGVDTRGRSVSGQRKSAKENGWKYNDGIDICPLCVFKPNKSKKQSLTAKLIEP